MVIKIKKKTIKNLFTFLIKAAATAIITEIVNKLMKT